MTRSDTAPNLELVRTHRDRAGKVRVYVDHDGQATILGTVTQVRTTNRGRACNRWLVSPSHMAWTLGVIGAELPPLDQRMPLDDKYVNRADAIRALVDHLRASNAVAVTSLYRDAHAA